MVRVNIESRHLRGVQAAVDYAESELPSGPVKAREMAWQACMSPFHFDRIFVEALGTTPGAYVRMRRLSLAACRLLDAPDPAWRIGQELGYGSPEAFARAFRRQFHLWPGEFRSYGIPFQLVPRASLSGDGGIGGAGLGEPAILQVAVERFAGLFRRGRNDHAANMRVFYELIHRSNGRFDPDLWIFLDRFLPVGDGTFLYEMFVGWPVDSLTDVPEGLEPLEVPSHAALEVSYSGRVDDLLETAFWDGIWGGMVASRGAVAEPSVWKPERSPPGTDCTGRRRWTFEIPLA